MRDRLSFGPLGALNKQKLTAIGCVLVMISIGFMFRTRILIGTRNWPTQTMIAARLETLSSETNSFLPTRCVLRPESWACLCDKHRKWLYRHMDLDYLRVFPDGRCWVGSAL